jgi:hypothetical protein
MLFGHTIRAPYDSGSATYFSPWFPRQGTKAVFACNLINYGGVSTFAISVETKKIADDNEAANIQDVTGGSTNVTLTADSVTAITRGIKLDGSESVQGFQELVRLKYVLTSAASARGWVTFRMLDTTWETD